MNPSKMPKATGVALAMAAAGLLGACQSDGTRMSSASAKIDLVHCYGVNACAGHNDCKTASNACAGKASCKGHGFVNVPAKACGDLGGEIKGHATGSVSKADLVHCYGVNACAGHNDCKTANNACAAKASCKGKGFVAMPAKACKDVGGKKGA
jgi:hypothetical protein